MQIINFKSLINFKNSHKKTIIFSKQKTKMSAKAKGKGKGKGMS